MQPEGKVTDGNIEPAPKISNISVKTIIDDINSAPPFQRESVSEHYTGIYVKWEGRLWDIQKIYSPNKSKKEVRVIIHTIPENQHYSALFIVNIDEYPDLKIAKRDSLIVAEGKIIYCSGDGMYVEIDPSNLQIIN